jgi:hypothetical protein
MAHASLFSEGGDCEQVETVLIPVREQVRVTEPVFNGIRVEAFAL